MTAGRAHASDATGAPDGIAARRDGGSGHLSDISVGACGAVHLED